MSWRCSVALSTLFRVLTEENPVRWVVRFIPIAIVEPSERVLELFTVALWHLHPRKHPPVCRAMVAIMEKGDVPACA